MVRKFFAESAFVPVLLMTLGWVSPVVAFGLLWEFPSALGHVQWLVMAGSVPVLAGLVAAGYAVGERQYAAWRKSL